MQITETQIERITSQSTIDAALQVCGEVAPKNAHHVRLAYIRAVFGSRATGGFFDPTAAKVNAKFAEAWETAQKEPIKMATTTYTTWTQIFPTQTFENACDADPNNDLELTPWEREAFLRDCKTHLETEVDKILASYGATILGNGEIVGPVDRADDFREALDDECGDLREELGMIDFDEVINRY